MARASKLVLVAILLLAPASAYALSALSAPAASCPVTPECPCAHGAAH